MAAPITNRLASRIDSCMSVTHREPSYPRIDSIGFITTESGGSPCWKGAERIKGTCYVVVRDRAGEIGGDAILHPSNGLVKILAQHIFDMSGSLSA